MEKMTVYIRNGNKYIETYSATDPAIIYRQLTTSLIAKKINCCNWIKSIKRVNLYNGYIEITVNDITGKSVYIIKE